MDQQIRGLVQFTAGILTACKMYKNKQDGPSAVLDLSALLTPDLADHFRCRPAVFREDGKPHPGMPRHDIEGIIRDVDLHLPHIGEGGKPDGFDSYRPESIKSLSVEVEGMVARLYMTVKIKSRFLELAALMENVPEKIEFAIRPLQGELPFDLSGKIGGTRATVGGDKAGNAEKNGPLFSGVRCVHCDSEVPRNVDGMHMLNGELVACPNPNPEAEASNGPALPAMHVVGSGRGPKKRNARAPGF